MLFIKHLKASLKNFQKNKTYSFINIGGLSLGIAAFILISLYIQYEHNWDTFNKNYQNIYRLEQNIQKSDQDELLVKTPFLLGPELVNHFPEVDKMVRLKIIWEVTLSSSNERTFRESGDTNGFISGFYADNSLFDIFTIPFLKGSPEKALNQPYSMVLTERMADKYFPDTDPVGKFITFENKLSCKVTGVIRNPRPNSHFNYKFLISLKTHEVQNQNNASYKNWNNSPVFTYVLLNKISSSEKFPEKLKPFLNQYNRKYKSTLYLKPLSRIHFSLTEFDMQSNTNIIISYLFAAVGLFILLVAFFNFMNLTTAASITRSKEIGIKKVAGADRNTLIRHFLGESVMFSLLATGIGLAFAELFMPFFNQIVKRDLSIQLIENWSFFTFILLITIIAGLLSGIYPAFYLSSIKPAQIFKGIPKLGNKKTSFNHVLVLFQFLISMIMIGGTFTVTRQIKYLKNKDLGFNQENILVNQFNHLDSQSLIKYKTLKNELLKTSQVSRASISSQSLMFGYEWDDFRLEGSGPDEKKKMIFTRVDYDFLDTYQIKIKEGRQFSPDFPSDLTDSCIINETTQKEFGWKSAIGKRIFWNDHSYTVIGVTKDFHFFTLYWKIQPHIMVMVQDKLGGNNVLSLKISGNDIKGSREFITKKIKEFFPGKIIQLRLIKEFADKNYHEIMDQVANAIGFFSFLTIIIASLGLFSLVSFNTIQRTKEIGIRKVIGASVIQIFYMMIKKFIKLFLIALLLAWPIIYILMNQTLKEMPYRIHFQAGIFLLTGLISLGIILLTVSFKSLKAATANPVEALRYE